MGFRLQEQAELSLEPRIVKLFRFIDEKKKTLKTKAQLLEYIGSMMKYLGLPNGFELYVLESYLLNYRKDGDYSGLTKDNFINPRTRKGKRTTNVDAWKYAISLMPFEGSNLRGSWIGDAYVITSYSWYPVYIYKNNRWYQVTQPYSSSTGRHMRRVNPVNYDENLNSKIFWLTPDEMRMILNGKSHEEVMKHKLEKIKEKESELVSKRKSIKRVWDYGRPGPKINIKFNIKSIDIEGDKAIVNVDINDVVKREGGKSVPTPENYLKGEIEGVDKEYVERELETLLKPNFKDYVGGRYTWGKPLSDFHNIKFNFNHLRK